jgi:hypothetical protein
MKTDHILTKEYLNELFEYKDGNLFWKKAKVGTAKGSLAGTKSHHYYQVCINYKIYRNHRLIWIFHNGNTENCIDHINGNTFDNRIENLRSCNISENLWNSKKPKNNTSGIKGVSWDKKRKRWRARVLYKNQEFHVGFFVNLEEAKIKLQQKRESLHSQFCNHG